MCHLRKALTELRQFRAHQRGTVGIMFALASVPMILAAGAGLDMIRANHVRTKLQVAIDAGALAAAATRHLSEEERIQQAKTMFHINFDDPFIAGLPDVVINKHSVEMSARAIMPTAFMRLAGIDTMQLSTRTTVNLPTSKNAEIALVLDYSGSMNERSGGKVKYVAMREAAINLVRGLTENDDGRVRFGLVPFSHHVRVTLPSSFVNGARTSGNWTGCTQDRMFPHNTNASTPGGNPASKWGHDFAPQHANRGCGGYAPRNLTVRPISDDHEGVIGQLQSMRPYAWTHIALGFSFAWHLLSPGAPFTDVEAYDDEETEKIIVLLTDGRQTEPAFGPGGRRNVRNGERNLERLCDNAKAKDITVVTVAFDLDDMGTTQRLRRCSTDPDKHFFIAEDDAQLSKAFDAIRVQLQQAIYLSR